MPISAVNYDEQLKFLQALLEVVKPAGPIAKDNCRMILSIAQSVKTARDHNYDCRQQPGRSFLHSDERKSR